ncbi:Arabinanase/levansucrase/invertase [Hirschfeldia incana]|nr:Arabinanase/levansucrase/invertase [Hirschfeldia incana]
MEANAIKLHGNPSILTASSTPHRHRSSSILSLHYRNKRCSPFPLTVTRCSTTKSNQTGQDSSLSTSSKKGLVLDLGNDSWDSEEIGSPVVKRFLSDNEERWYMWYHGRNSSDSVGLAVSNNGIHWERGKGRVESTDDVGLVMGPCEDWWAFDKAHVRPGEVVIMSSSKVRADSSVYWMYYTGYTTETVEFLQSQGLNFELGNPERFENGSVLRSLPGLAISQDGRHWARIEGEHHTGALFDVGSEKDWDFLYIASPHVVFHENGDLRMYYHSFDAETGEFCVGMARSREGIKWVKFGKILGGRESEKEGLVHFDEMGGRYPCVTRNKRDGSYVMAYEGVDRNGKTSIGLAVSEDGIKNWRRVDDVGAVLGVGEGGAWDDGGVGCPYLIEMDGENDHQWRLYYRGVGNGGRTGIGLAVSEGNEITKFTKQTGICL